MPAASTVVSWLTARAPWLIRLVGRLAPKPPGVELIEQLNAYWTSQAISSAARLGVADALGSSRRDSPSLAVELGLDPIALHRLLRALAGAGIVEQGADATFALTRRGELLRRDTPNSLHSLALLTGGVWYRAFAELDRAVASGEPAFPAIYGEPFFAHLDAHPELAADFHRGMQAISALEDPLIALAYDYSKHRVIVDVGGGTGGLLFAILRAHPQVTGVLFDRPSSIESARTNLPAELEGRVRLEGGDFFASVPAGGDVYVLKSIIHDWDRASAKAILENCRAVVPEHGRLLLVEHVIGETNEPEPGKMIDLLMLSTLGGMERTIDEYRALLTSVGFELVRQYPTVSPISLIEAKPARGIVSPLSAP